MRDIEAVESIVAGDSGGLADAYDAYADLLYAYCRSMLGDPEDAAEALQAAFVIAGAHADGLRDRAHLRAWLFAIARNQCLRRHASGHAPAPGRGTATATAEIGTDAERVLLRAALDGLDPVERDVLTLLWHGLDIADVTLVLDASRNDVYSVFSRARDQLETCVAAALVGRHGRDDCASLDSLLGDWDGTLTVGLRNRVSRHIGQCDVCTARRERELRPALRLSLGPGALLGAAEEARASIPPPPSWLRDRMLWLVTTYDPEATAERAAMERQGGSFGATGFPKPRPADRGRRPRHPRLLVTAALTIAAVAGLTAALVAPGGTPRQSAQGAANRPHEVAGLSGSAVGGGTSTASPAAGEQASPSGTPSSSPSPSPSRHGASPSVAPSATRASASTSATPSAPAKTPVSSPASGPPTGPPGASPGTLAVSTSSISVVAPFASTLTLTASGASVHWFAAFPSSVAGELSVSPSSGTLRAGHSVTVSITSNTASSFRTTLTVSPGGHQVAVAVGFG